MSNNSNLSRAKTAKNDEFYTLYSDIEKEISLYDLKGKFVYCPCDDYRWSNFVKYFKKNFKLLGLTKLVATNYDIGDGAFEYIFDGVNEKIILLEGNGDFMSDECTCIKNECDVVITNPPFSLFRKFINWLKDEDEL